MNTYFTKSIGKVWLVFFKDRIETVCDDESSCLRYMSQWAYDRNLSLPEVTNSFSFVQRDITKLTLRKTKLVE